MRFLLKFIFNFVGRLYDLEEFDLKIVIFVERFGKEPDRSRLSFLIDFEADDGFCFWNVV